VRWRKALEQSVRTARLMVGVPDYDLYLMHCATAHPGAKVMTRAEFLRNRMERRFITGGGTGRCC
jgi:uncharacterized short protein YbdD (DUF466 family)